MSKTRYKLGDMFLVAVSDQLKAVGRVLRKDYTRFLLRCTALDLNKRSSMDCDGVCF